MTTMPAMLLSFLGIVMNSAACIVGLATDNMPLCKMGLTVLADFFCGTYLTIFVVGLVTLVTEWRQIHTHTAKKVLYLFTFPLFMLTYIPIAFQSLYKRVTWTPIVHKRIKTVEDIQAGDRCE